MRWTLLILAGCGGGPADAPTRGEWRPELVCPTATDPLCPNADGALRVGVAVRSIVPDCYESWQDLDGDAVWSTGDEPFFDCGCDRLCPGDPAHAAPDEGEGDGVFQAIWLAGFDNKRPASGLRGADRGMIGAGDDLQARVLVIERGSTRVAIVALDAFGVMHDQVLQIRDAVNRTGAAIDHVLVQSSHSHSAPDTLGIYGPSYAQSGWNPVYADQIAATVAEATAEAASELVEVEMSWGEVDSTTYAPNGAANLISDLRDPVIIDPRVGAIRFAHEGGTVATVVHWGNHPETIADENNLMTADFVHGLRQTVESGSRWPGGMTRAGIGGTALFLNGTVGGMMSSLHASVVDPEGQTWSAHSWEKVDAVGQIVGEMALDALASAQVVEDPALRVGMNTIELPVINLGFQAMFRLDVFAERETVGWDAASITSDTNRPNVVTEIDLLELGPLRLLTIPGELLPEAAIGGYDGSFTPPGVPIIAADNPNPPDLSQAPPPPYLLDRLGGQPGWVVSLGNDELGYIIPPYNFVLADAGAWLTEAEGDHYEETNSIGPDTLTLVEAGADELIVWFDAN